MGSWFQKKELRRILPLGLFWAVYTLIFLLWQQTFFFTLPFLLGLLIAIAVQPVISFFDRKLHWNHKWSTAIVIILSFLLLSAAAAFLCVTAVQEITAFFRQASQNGFAEFSRPIMDFFNKVGSFLQKFHLELQGQGQERLLEYLQNNMELVMGFLNLALEVLSSLPVIFTLLLVTAASAFFMAKDLEKGKVWLKKLFSADLTAKIKQAAHRSGNMGQRYLLSYLFLYFITFCETYVILNILSVSYPLAISLGTAAADILPILGPGFVFLPLTIYYLLIGAYAKAAGLLIGWAIISVIRQILEPKLISATIKVHPLAMLAAIYFSLVGKSLWLFFYFLGLFLLYSVFRRNGILPKLAGQDNSAVEKESAP